MPLFEAVPDLHTIDVSDTTDGSLSFEPCPPLDDDDEKSPHNKSIHNESSEKLSSEKEPVLVLTPETTVITTTTTTTTTATTRTITPVIDEIDNPIPLQHQTKVINNKPKSLTALPMPPGVSVEDLVNAPTPSPPNIDSDSPLRDPLTPSPTYKNVLSSSILNKPTILQKSNNSSIVTTTSTTSNNNANPKSLLLNLPMPPMVPGSEDLSGDDEVIGSPDDFGNCKILNTPKTDIASSSTFSTTTTKRRRPVILNRRDSRINVRDWGERCVDVFEMITQIGEGTYGQVSTHFSNLISTHKTQKSLLGYMVV